MEADRFLGVDGGGTKTRFVLVDGAGRVLAEAARGTTYHPQVGLDGVQAILADGIGQVLQAAGMPAEAVTQAFFGLPAHGEDSQATARLDAIPAAILGHHRYACDNDMVCGWAGSLGGADGINIIAGTGSMGYGQRQGLGTRAGGWGEAFSDEGSAHWIAIQGLNAFSKMSDGRLPRGPLHGLVVEALRLENDLELCAHVYGDGGATRDAIARLSPLVAQAAQAGDEIALGIFRQAGSELAAIAEALRRALGYAQDETVALSYSGGAFNAGDLLLAPFKDALASASRRFELRTPLHEPHYGAALYAARLAGRPLRA